MSIFEGRGRGTFVTVSSSGIALTSSCPRTSGRRIMMYRKTDALEIACTFRLAWHHENTNVRYLTFLTNISWAIGITSDCTRLWATPMPTVETMIADVTRR